MHKWEWCISFGANFKVTMKENISEHLTIGGQLYWVRSTFDPNLVSFTAGPVEYQMPKAIFKEFKEAMEEADSCRKKMDNFRRSRDYFKAERDNMKEFHEKVLKTKNDRILILENQNENLSNQAHLVEQECMFVRQELLEAEHDQKIWKTTSAALALFIFAMSVFIFWNNFL